MRSPLPATVVIECPHCRTRYQVSADTIGPRGRQVLCAHCSRSWQADVAVASSDIVDSEDAADRMFEEAEEQELDAAFAAAAPAALPEAKPAAAMTDDMPVFEVLQEPEEQRMAAAPPPVAVAPESDAGRTTAFRRRQDKLVRGLPLAQLRRLVRIVALTVLALLVVGFIAFRTEVVRALPDLAGAYETLGLGVNVLGVEFSNFATTVVRRDGLSVLRVDARIDNVGGRSAAVPAVVVSLLDAAGTSLYEWSVQPETRDLEPSEAVEFSTQVNSPPADATQVRLSFASGRAQPKAPIAAIETGTP